MYKYNLGDKLVCKVTGFSGIVTARVEFLNGCVQYCLQPSVNSKGEIPDFCYLDEHQLARVQSEVVPGPSNRRVGGPQFNTPSNKSN